MVSSSAVAVDERQRWKSGSVYTFSDNTEWSGRIAGEMQLDGGRGRVTATLFTSHYDHLSRSSTLPQPIAGDEGDRQLQSVQKLELLYNGTHGASSPLMIDAGASVRLDRLDSERIQGGDRSLTSVEPFAQVEIPFSAGLSLVPGLRLSHNSQWGGHLTPKIAARLHASSAVTLRASVGTGYRAPDFKELYMFFQNTSAGYAVHGNPDLVPEHSVNFTVGSEFTVERFYLRAQLFLNEFRDFIETRAISAPGDALLFEYANISNGRTQGIDLEGATSIGALRLELGASGLWSEDRATGQALLGRPEHAARMYAGYTLRQGTRLGLTTVFTGRTAMQRDETWGGVTSWRDAFLRADIQIAQRLFEGVELQLGADNVFDNRPSEWAGFTRRRINAGLTWNR
jgi:outer membrane receptor for ferrienterochelin and colicins